MNEQERAEEHLKTIRRLMERATIYRAISAPSALVGGLLSLAASFATWVHLNPAVPGTDHKNFYLWLWLLVLVLTAATNTLFIVLGAKKRNEPVFSASMKAALIALAPALLLGAVLTCLLAAADDDPGLYLFQSVIWATCYGLGLLATGHFAPRSLTLLGWAFLSAGIAGFTWMYLDLAGGTTYSFGYGSALPSTLFMATTFGLFHLIYAAGAWPRKGATQEP